MYSFHSFIYSFTFLFSKTVVCRNAKINMEADNLAAATDSLIGSSMAEICMAYSRERRGDVRDKSTTCGEKGHSEQKTM
jgi:hypothetical protein